MMPAQTLEVRTPLTELALWLIGAPASGLLSLFIYSSIPRIADGRAEFLISSGICSLIFLLLIWNLAWSALAHLASLSILPQLLKRPLIRLITAIGTQQAKRVIMCSGAGAAVGLTLISGGFSGIAFATPADLPSDSQGSSTDYDLSWGAPQTPASANPTTRPSESTTTHPIAPPEPSVATPPPEDSAEAEPSVQRITVTPGQSLWSISAEILGPQASDADIAAFWPTLYTANADVIGSDAALIHPGQELILPKEML